MAIIAILHNSNEGEIMRYYNENGTLIQDDGKFRCQACLECKHLSELSLKDARYCDFCQPIIEYEYSLLSTGSHSKRYKPMPLKSNSTPIEAPPIYKPTDEVKTKMSTSRESPVNELLHTFREFRVLRYREGVIEDKKAIASILAQKV